MDRSQHDKFVKDLTKAISNVLEEHRVVGLPSAVVRINANDVTVTVRDALLTTVSTQGGNHG